MALGFNSTTDDVLAGVDLTGKTILVTGASGGLGEETARALAARGAGVTIAARSQDKLDAAAARIGKGTGRTVETGLLALDRPESVRTFAETWMAGHDQLNVLINNAGVMACPLSRTREGWEMQFATNHLGHFLLTNLLLPALKKGAPGRVVNLSSAAHLYATVDLEDPNFVSRATTPTTTPRRPTGSPRPPISGSPGSWTSVWEATAFGRSPCNQVAFIPIWVAT